MISALKSQISGIQRGLDADLARLNAEKKKLDGQIFSTKTALTLKAKALATYVELSLDDERVGILNRYPSK